MVTLTNKQEAVVLRASKLVRLLGVKARGPDLTTIELLAIWGAGERCRYVITPGLRDDQAQHREDALLTDLDWAISHLKELRLIPNAGYYIVDLEPELVPVEDQ